MGLTPLPPPMSHRTTLFIDTTNESCCGAGGVLWGRGFWGGGGVYRAGEFSGVGGSMGQGGFYGVRSRLATPISLCPASCLKPRPLDKPRPPLPSSQRVGRCGERYGALWGLWGSMGGLGLYGVCGAPWVPMGAVGPMGLRHSRRRFMTSERSPGSLGSRRCFFTSRLRPRPLPEAPPLAEERAASS